MKNLKVKDIAGVFPEDCAVSVVLLEDDNELTLWASQAEEGLADAPEDVLHRRVKLIVPAEDSVYVFVSGYPGEYYDIAEA